MKNTEEFRQFLRDHVNLDQSRIDDLDQRITALSNYLSNNHDGFKRTEKQGSYAQRTIIRPKENGAKFDADLLVVMDDISDNCKDYVLGLYETLKKSNRYNDKIKLKNKCVTVVYAKETKCSVDLVPCVVRNGVYYVCPRDGDFEETDGTGYRTWLNGRNALTNGNLKRATRLIKQMRDHHSKIDCRSVVLTTYIGESIEDSDEGNDPVKTEADTIETVLTRIADRLEDTPCPPDIRNPALPSETFSHGWTRSQYNRFKGAVRDMADKATAAKAEPDKEKSIELWQKLFGKDFVESSQPSSGNANNRNKSSNATIHSPGAARRNIPPAAGIPVVRRPNDGRRFG